MQRPAETVRPPLLPHEPTPLLTISKIRGPFIYSNPIIANAYPCEAFLASIANATHFQSLHVITYLRSNTHKNSLPPDLWRYYLCAALARHHAYTIALARPKRQPMSAVHRARYSVFRECFAAALLAVIEKGDYGRPSPGRQNAMIDFEEELTRISFRAWPSALLLRPCLQSNVTLLREMRRLLDDMGFLSVVAVEHPERRGEWVARRDPAEWLMDRVDEFHHGWIEHWDLAKEDQSCFGLDERERWTAVEEAKQEVLDTCEDWVDHIEAAHRRRGVVCHSREVSPLVELRRQLLREDSLGLE